MLNSISIERVIESQRGAILQKQKLLATRLGLALSLGQAVPVKRTSPAQPDAAMRKLLLAYERVRKGSFEAMREQQKASPMGLEQYHALMEAPLQELKAILNIHSK